MGDDKNQQQQRLHERADNGGNMFAIVGFLLVDNFFERKCVCRRKAAELGKWKHTSSP